MKLVLASLLMAGMSWAASPIEFTTEVLTKVVQATVDTQAAIEWKKGDTNSYDLDMGFIKGSMVQSVRDITSEGIWVDQNMDMGFAGKQNASQLIDPNTGEIKKFIVNGKEQEVPKQGEQEVIEVKEDNIRVPAGTFDCIFAKIKDKQSGDITQAWINPEKVSIGGMLKVIQPSQFGNVTIALKSYKKN
jgi:hypothetical protein